jgi:hypothetical protein
MSLISVQVYLGNQGCGSGKTPAFAGKIFSKQILQIDYCLLNVEC